MGGGPPHVSATSAVKTLIVAGYFGKLAFVLDRMSNTGKDVLPTEAAGFRGGRTGRRSLVAVLSDPMEMKLGQTALAAGPSIASYAPGPASPPPVRGGAASSGRGAAVSPDSVEWVLGTNDVMVRVARSIRRAAEVGCTVLVFGETGCGKEILARLLHRSGPRIDKPFVPVNCGALSTALSESQLFGHEKGAFTGADGRALGIFRAAEGGVVFLDEIGEMPMDLQTKLLRVLQQREVLPVGATQPVSIDVQVIAATNRDLQAEVAKGTFREDLYFRLNMIELRVPPLRERPEDIPEFIAFFSRQHAASYRMAAWEPSEEQVAEFCDFAWPGNVRQLSHVIEQAYVLQMEPELPGRQGASRAADGRLPFVDLEQLRKVAVRQALTMTGGHKARAAKLLGVHANTISRLIKEVEDDGDDDEG
ncbi:MAG: sigma-54-dependent Fis family transcriptional regulator [Planctomycetota bacterium]|nr:MAG: sigma-54-dependent Fis family transcriptional regulator [Planctomycetota bacterium]